MVIAAYGAMAIWWCVLVLPWVAQVPERVLGAGPAVPARVLRLLCPMCEGTGLHRHEGWGMRQRTGCRRRVTGVGVRTLSRLTLMARQHRVVEREWLVRAPG